MHCSVKSFGCPGCHKGFRSPKVLTDHIRAFHGYAYGWICIMDSKDQTKFDSTKTKSKKKVADKYSSNKPRKSEINDQSTG